MRILFILENFYPKIGGVETLFWQLATKLTEKGYQITVFTTAAIGAPKKEVLNGIQIIRTPYSNRYFFTFLSGFRVLRLAFGHDLIHTTSYNAAIPAFFGSLIARKHCIITFHEVWDNLWFKMSAFAKWKQLLHYYFEKFVLILPFEKFVGVSKYTTDALLKSGIEQHKIVKIYNGLDYDFLEKQKILSDTGETYLFYGRLGISKGIDILLDALQLLISKGIDVRLKMIIPTTGSAYNSLIREIKAKNLKENITIEDQVSYPILLSEIQSAKAVVIPSFTEGFCFVAAETAAMNTPIISSGKGALKEVATGQIIEMASYNSEDLADAFAKAEKGEWKNIPFKKFELSEAIKEYIDLYESI